MCGTLLRRKIERHCATVSKDQQATMMTTNMSFGNRFWLRRECRGSSLFVWLINS